MVIDTALLLHGHVSDELYVFSVKQAFVGLKNMNKIRETYGNGLRIHQNSSALYLEAFNCELAFCEKMNTQMLKSGNFKIQYKSWTNLLFYVFYV